MKKTSGIILALDTALGQTSIAVGKNGTVLASFHESARDDQAALLVPRIEGVLSQAGVSYGDLEAIAVCVGPGGFTSIRVGLAVARAMGFAAGLPVLGYSTLHIMRYGCGEQDITALLPAGRGQVFFQHFSSAENPPACVVEREALAPMHRIVTTLTDIKATHVISHDISRHAAWMVEMASQGEPALPPAPLYIKPPDALPQSSYLERLAQRPAT